MKQDSKQKKESNYQQQLYFLLWSIIPVFFLCYLLAFRKTAAVIKDYGRNKDLQQQAVLRTDSLKIYEEKQLAISNWKKQYLLDSSVMDAQILAAINNQCDRLGLLFKEYKPLGVNGRHIWTRIVSVEGGFRETLQLIYLMEEQERLCRIASVRYQKQKEEEGGSLRCSIYIQNIVGEK